jgi:serine protease inhibitor
VTYAYKGQGLTHKLDGPFYEDGRWTASITLRDIESKTFYGMTQKEVQAQMLRYLDQIVQELERAHTLLHKALERPYTRQVDTKP